MVSRGIQLPLEVFKTSNGRGWGVRCAEDVTIGTFICDYVGRLITDLQAVSVLAINHYDCMLLRRSVKDQEILATRDRGGATQVAPISWTTCSMLAHHHWRCV